VSGVAVLALVIGRIGMRGKAAEPEPVAGPAPEPAG
jgi:cytochrome b561